MTSNKKSSINFIKSELKFYGDTAIILGSGLGHISDLIDNKKTIKYKNIPYFPESTIEGHMGELVAGEIH